MNYLFFSLISVTIISLASLIGVTTLLVKKEYLDQLLDYLVIFATGAILGTVFFHMLPNAVEKQGSFNDLVGFGVLMGMFLSFVLEKYVHWHHHHSLNHQILKVKFSSTSKIKPYVYTNLFGDAVHNFIDGLTLIVAFYTNCQLGLIVSFGILIHELAQEFGDFGLLVQGGLSPSKALFFNLLSALTAIIGVIIGTVLILFAGELEILLKLIIPIAAGNFLYIAAVDLIPELFEEETARGTAKQIFILIIGIFILYGIKFLEIV